MPSNEFDALAATASRKILKELRAHSRGTDGPKSAARYEYPFGHYPKDVITLVFNTLKKAGFEPKIEGEDIVVELPDTPTS